jgi:hypothetical protein
LIDPKMIQEGLDMPDLGLPVKVSLDPQAFIEIARTLDDAGKYVELSTTGSALVFEQPGDDTARRFEITADPTVDVAPTLFSTSYLADFASGLSNGYAESVTLRWGEEFPLRVGFECENGATGAYLLAPRVRSE